MLCIIVFFFFFSSRRRHTRFDCDWSSDVCSSDLRLSPNATSARYKLCFLPIGSRKHATEVLAVSLHAPTQQNRADDHGDHGIAPAVAPDERRGHRQGTQRHERFALAVAVAPRAVPAFLVNAAAVRRPRVKQEGDSDESEKDAENEGERF